MAVPLNGCPYGAEEALGASSSANDRHLGPPAVAEVRRYRSVEVA